MATSERLNPYRVDPASYQAMLQLERHLEHGALDPGMRQLANARASQLNGCSYCLEMHTRKAHEAGVTQEHLDLLAGWREASCFTDQQRVALALNEAVTAIVDGEVPDSLWEQVQGNFSAAAAAQLLFTIGATNNWNRVNIAVRLQPPARPAAGR